MAITSCSICGDPCRCSRHLTRKEAAEYCRVSERFLGQRHPGLKVVRLGRRVFYRREHLDAWMDRCTRDQADEPAPDSPPGERGPKSVALTPEARELADALRDLERRRAFPEPDRRGVRAEQRRRAKKS